MTEWREIVQGSLGGLGMYPRDRVMGFVASFPCGVGYVYRGPGIRGWYGVYEPENGAERMVSEPYWRRGEAFGWCERMGGVAPVALSLGI